MTCTCDSASHQEFSTEIFIHTAGFASLNKPTILVFQRLSVCMNCGSTEFIIPGPELKALRDGMNRKAKARRLKRVTERTLHAAADMPESAKRAIGLPRP